MSDEIKGITVVVPMPKASQFEASGQVKVYASTRDEVEQLFDSVFGEESFKAAVARAYAGFFMGATVVPDPSTPAATAATSAPAAAASTGGNIDVGSVCPNCGQGTLTRKNTRDGKRSFIGCDAYPNCNYILKGRN